MIISTLARLLALLLGPAFLDDIRDAAQLTKQLRELQSGPTADPGQMQTYSAQVSSVQSKLLDAGPRFGGIIQEWKNHIASMSAVTQSGVDDKVKKQWLSEEEVIVRRVLNQLMESYRVGSTTLPSSV